jgi:hypothetical protein
VNWKVVGSDENKTEASVGKQVERGWGLLSDGVIAVRCGGGSVLFRNSGCATSWKARCTCRPIALTC